jgi:hypothetical protein
LFAERKSQSDRRLYEDEAEGEQTTALNAELASERRGMNMHHEGKRGKKRNHPNGARKKTMSKNPRVT